MKAAAARRLTETYLVWGMALAIDIYECDAARIRDAELVQLAVNVTD